MRDIAIDTETWLIQPGRLAPRLVCLTYADGGRSGIFHRSENDLRATFAAWLWQPDVRFVGANTAYDMGVLCQEFPDLLPRVFEAYEQGRILDVSIRDHLRCIALGETAFDGRTDKPPDYSLAGVVKAHFGEDVAGKKGPDAWRLRYHELDVLPISAWPEDAREYATEDARLTLRVHLAQEEAGRTIDYERQCAYAWALHLMAAWGVRTDIEAVRELRKTLEESVGEKAFRLQQVGIVRENGTKNMAAIQALVKTCYEAKDLPLPATPGGAISTSGEVLKESGDEMLVLLAAVNSEQKVLSTYVPALERGTEYPICARWNVLVDTGRTSCSDPNLQNPPRKGDVRKCFVPRAGYVFAGCDYHLAELCSLAQVLTNQFGHSEMCEALKAGRDLHLDFGASMLGITYEEALKRKRDPDVKNARQTAKVANFGFPGGLGAEALVAFAHDSYDVDLSVDQAKELRNAWLGKYPEMKEYFRDVGRQVELSGGSWQVVQTGSGRLRGGCGYTQGCNTSFQGLTADGAKRALFAVQRECWAVPQSPLYGSRPVLFLHDEIIMESPEALARGAAKRLSEVMCAEMQRMLPDVPVKADAHIMRRWYKDAEPTYDAAGLLVPWEPRA